MSSQDVKCCFCLPVCFIISQPNCPTLSSCLALPLTSCHCMYNSYQKSGSTRSRNGVALWHLMLSSPCRFSLPPLPLVVAPCHFCCLLTLTFISLPILAVCSFATLNMSVHTEAYAFCINFSLVTGILVQFHTINNLVTHQPNCL